MSHRLPGDASSGAASARTIDPREARSFLWEQVGNLRGWQVTNGPPPGRSISAACRRPCPDWVFPGKRSDSCGKRDGIQASSKAPCHSPLRRAEEPVVNFRILRTPFLNYSFRISDGNEQQPVVNHFLT